MKLKVKICGITRVEDALESVEAGADALGFMFYEASKRNIAPELAAEIIRALPPFVAKVGVFVNAPEDFTRDVIARTGIDTLQLHGEETPEFCGRFAPMKVIKAFRVRDRESLRECAAYRNFTWLLDSHVAGAQGGTGVAFDREIAAEAARHHARVILAGGLKADTVAAAVRQVRPFGVDVSSGVESAPGVKDHGKLRAFIAAARAGAAPA
jgi:phosphoribosylanthranilate isomerase